MNDRLNIKFQSMQMRTFISQHSYHRPLITQSLSFILFTTPLSVIWSLTHRDPGHKALRLFLDGRQYMADTQRHLQDNRKGEEGAKGGWGSWALAEPKSSPTIFSTVDYSRHAKRIPRYLTKPSGAQKMLARVQLSISKGPKPPLNTLISYISLRSTAQCHLSEKWGKEGVLCQIEQLF